MTAISAADVDDNIMAWVANSVSGSNDGVENIVI